MPSSAPGRGSQSSQSSVASWRLTQVFGGDKAPDEEIPEGLPGIRRFPSHTPLSFTPQPGGLRRLTAFVFPCAPCASCAKRVTADIVSSLRFDDSGEFLAAGDKGGRIVIFQRADTPRPAVADSGAAGDSSGGETRRHHKHAPKAEFRFFAEFQSHEAEFDYLKSMEIEEKINQIVFLPRFNAGLMLMTTNDKTVKLWKVFPKNVYQMLSPVDSPVGTAPPTGPPAVVLPEIEPVEETMTAVPKRIFANAHSYHINSISLSSDQQTFLSSDDLRINLWSLDSSEESFSLLLSFPLLCFCLDFFESHVLCFRHRGHQAREHGGALGGHHLRVVPPNRLLPVLLQHVQGSHSSL